MFPALFMSDDDDEFEDAVEAPANNLTAMKHADQSPSATTASSSAFPVPLPRTLPTRPTRSVVAQPFSTPTTSTEPNAAGTTSRRDRIAALRNRMRDDFGTRDTMSQPVSSVTGDCDAFSVVSDVTSLHSWHRRVLAGPDTVVVLPSDSVSTRAMSVSDQSSLWSPQQSDPPPAPLSRIETLPEHGELIVAPKISPRPPPPLPSQPPVMSPSSPTSPPPTHPPPPLPSSASVQGTRDRGLSTPSDWRVPPPLPPRNPSLRLPDPVAAELVARLSVVNSDHEEEEDSFYTPNAKSNETITACSGRSPRLSTNSNDSIASVGDGGSSRRKGHTKTNSLDRGLTLAKSLKAGPFPPPSASNKANSLTRAKDGEGGEEQLRNSAAEGVIRQITIGCLHEKMECETLEPITSGSSSISSPSSHQSKSTNNKDKKKRKDKGTRVSRDLVQVQTTLVEKESPPPPAKAPESLSSAQQERLVDVMQDSGLQSPLDFTDSRDHSVSLCSSIDPITRDVERRMSMKRDGTMPTDQMSDDGKSDRFSTTRSTVDHAKTLARNYGNFASGIFKGALQKVKGVAHGGASSSKHVEEEHDTSLSDGDGEQSESGVAPVGGSGASGGSIVRPRKAKKGPFDFEQLRITQELNNEHTGAVWCIRFSVCGRLMATAGQDGIMRIWAVRSHMKYFQEMRERYQQKQDTCGSASDVFESTLHDMESFRPPSSADSQPASESTSDQGSPSPGAGGGTALFAPKPFAVFKGHVSDILDVSWSKNYFILSSGMDRTVKLWHISRNECLCLFQHIDIVTCVAFLPKDDRYFLSGSLDGKLRLWHIPDKKVAVWNEVQVKFITAITFVKNGKFAVVGTYNGRCYFYTSDQLKYHTVVDVRSTRGRNARGHKVTGLAVHGDKLLVTSNDSRIRMYDVRDKALTCKFRGAQTDRSQIRAAFSPDGRHIVCGSEDKFIYLWRTADLPSTLSVRKDRNAMWERVRAHETAVSVAVFAPKPQVFLSMLTRNEPPEAQTERGVGHVIVSADLAGGIKVFVNRPPATKTGQSTFFSHE